MDKPTVIVLKTSEPDGGDNFTFLFMPNYLFEAVSDRLKTLFKYKIFLNMDFKQLDLELDDYDSNLDFRQAVDDFVKLAQWTKTRATLCYRFSPTETSAVQILDLKIPDSQMFLMEY